MARPSGSPEPRTLRRRATGPRALHLRFNAVLNGHQADATTPLSFTSLQGFNLRDEDSTEALFRVTDAVCPELIIVDSFTDLLRGSGTTALGAALPPLLHLRRLAEFTQAAILVLHHTNRHGSFQGSAAIAASMDTILAIESAPQSQLIKLHTLKSRFGVSSTFAAQSHFEGLDTEHPSFFLALAPPSDHASSTSGSPSSPQAVVSAGITGLALTLYLSDFYSAESFTFKQLCANHQGYPAGSIRNAIQQLLDEGIVVRADGGGRGKKATYTRAHPTACTTDEEN